MKVQISRFALVGVLATLVHLAIGTTLIGAGLAPLLANPVAFVTAFLVSFTGHHWITFAGHGRPLTQTLSRFAVTAVLGFCVNEAALAVLVGATPVPPAAALVASTGLAAVVTFGISRTWAFRSQALEPGGKGY